MRRLGLFLVVSAAMAAAVLWRTNLSVRVHGSSTRPQSVPVQQLRHADEPFVQSLLAADQPRIVRGSVVKTWPAMKLWSAQYVGKHAGKLHGLYKGVDPVFGPYYDESKPLHSGTRASRNRKRYEIVEGTWEDLLQSCNSPGGGPYVYYTGDIDATPKLLPDVLPLDDLMLSPQSASINVWFGCRGVVAPFHYDGYHNLYAQIRGTKHFLLFPPHATDLMREFPFLHPSHAQSQLAGRIPSNTSHLSLAWEAELQPGDLLYLPPGWWHQVTANPGSSLSMSVNVWSRSSEPDILGQLLAVHQEALVSLPVPQLQHVLHTVIASVMAMTPAQHMATTAQLYEPCDFVWHVLRSRFQPLVASGELPRDGTPPCGAASVPQQPTDTQLAPRIVTYFKKFRPSTRATWLGHLLEIVAFHRAQGQPGRLVSFLFDCMACHNHGMHN